MKIVNIDTNGMKQVSNKFGLYRTMHWNHPGYRMGNHGMKTLGWWAGLILNSKGSQHDPWDGERLSVLELGCGNGTLCQVLTGMGIGATGMDFMECKELYDRRAYSFIQQDLAKTPYDLEGGQFDYCVSFDVLEHIEEEFIPGVLKEMQRVSGRGMFIKVASSGSPPLHLTVHDHLWWVSMLRKYCPDFEWKMLKNFGQPSTRCDEGTVYSPLFYGRRLADED